MPEPHPVTVANTHGYGVALAPGSQVNNTGQPNFLDPTTQSNTAPRCVRVVTDWTSRAAGFTNRLSSRGSTIR